MYLTLAHDGQLTLEDSDDFKRFHIAATKNQLSASASFAEIAEDAGDDHYWVNADAVIALSPSSGDEEWMHAFETMLVKSAPYGYADLAGRRIKAHVVAPDQA